MSDKLKEALDAVAELGRLQGRVIALEALLDSEKAENARLKAEVAELKSQPDPLTAYLYAAELAKDEIKRLKAEVERLTKAEDKMIEITYMKGIAGIDRGVKS